MRSFPEGAAGSRTEKCGADHSFYTEASRGEDFNRRMFEESEEVFRQIEPVLKSKLPRSAESLLEIGAGSCAMGALLGRWLGARRIVFSDLSLPHIERASIQALGLARFSPPAVELKCLDMNEPFSLPDRSVDVVLFHAALHHARDIWNCLSESFRVLKGGGCLVAVREQMCAPLRAGRILGRLLESKEVRKGVSENAYLVEQYLYYLQACRFTAEAVPIAHGCSYRGLKRALRFANGWLFSSFLLVGCKPAAEATGT